jgi:hypothetical protein
MRNEELEHSFYAKEFNLSYTSLSMMMDSPLQFYKEYVLGEKDVKNERYFTKGKIVHYLMLDNGMFDEHFILASNGIPSENTEKVLRIVLTRHLELKESGEEKGESLEDYKEEILDILKAMNLHQSLVDDKKHPFITGDEKRIEKIIDEKSKNYFTFLLNQGNREIIDPETLEKCMVTAELLKADKNICMLLGLDLEGNDPNYGVYNELYHSMRLAGFPFGLHGVIDNMVVDVRNKTVRINDLKTTSKTVSEFEDSVTKYKYWIQAVIYGLLAKSYLKEVIDETWQIEVRFVVVDKYRQYYAFRVSADSMKEWNVKTAKCLNQAKYHYTSKDYSLPYKFLAGEVEL